MSDVNAALAEIATWPAEAQLELVERVWDRLVESGWRPELTEAQKTEFDRRLADLDANPGDVLTWDEIEQHVRRPR